MANRGATMMTVDGIDYYLNDSNITKEFDPALANEAGAYVTYEGDLYRFTAASSANTTWANRSKTLVYLAAELKEAKENAVPATRTVNGHPLSSDVTVTKADVGLGNVDNTSDANKPVSTAQAAAISSAVAVEAAARDAAVDQLGDALVTEAAARAAGDQSLEDTKVPKTTKVNGHALSSDVTVTKSDVGLGNVDNTSDVNKPVSTAQQAAIDAEAATRAAADADLKSAINGRTLVSPTWESGRYHPDTGDKAASNTYIRTADKIAYDEAYAVIISNSKPINVRCRIAFYKSNNDYINSSSFINRSFMLKDIVPADTAYFAISGTRDSGAGSGNLTTSYGECFMITDWHNTLIPIDSELKTNFDTTASELNTTIGNIGNAVFGRKKITPSWESGRWSPEDGSKVTGTGYIRTTEKLAYSNDIAIMITNQLPINVRIRVGFFDSSSNFLGITPFITRSFMIRDEAPEGTAYFVISAVKASSGDNIDVSYGDTIEITDWHDTLYPKGENSGVGLFNLNDIIQFADEYGEFSESFTYSIPFNKRFDNQIFTCTAKYTRDEGATGYPRIKFDYAWNVGVNGTTYYEIGQEGSYKRRQWRVGRPYEETNNLKMTVTIPEGIHVKIVEFYNSYDNHIERNVDTIRFDGHRKFPGMPSDTMPSVEMCAMVGFGSMIEIPKRLSDGVWVFYHDDSLKYNDTFIRQADGTQLPSTYNGTLWKNISSDEAFSWDWGVSFHNGEYAGTKPMTMQDFFMECAKTGMKPMFSIHPSLTEEQYGEIKTLAKRYNVLNQLGIVAPASDIPIAYSVLGNDIDEYLLIVSSGDRTSSDIQSAINTLNGLTGCTTKRGIELFAGTAYSAYFNATEANRYNAFEMITEAGYVASLASQNGARKPVSGSTGIYEYGPDIEYWIREHGVTEFCYEQGYNSGLIW